MKRNIFYIFILTLIININICAETQPNQAWLSTFNGTANNSDVSIALKIDNSGNVYVIGRVTQSNGEYDYLTIKYDSSGVQQWASTYNGPGNQGDYINDLEVDSSGNVYVTGYSWGTNHNDYATIKYGPNGNQLWVARYDRITNHDDDWAYALKIDLSGNVYVTGYTRGSTSYDDYTTIKYDTNGNQLWVANYNGPGNSTDNAYALEVDNFGNVYVTGNSYDSTTDYDYATIKYNSLGQQQWVARYDYGYMDYAKAITIDKTGCVYVTGKSFSANWDDFATVKYNNNGNQLWVARYDGPAHDGDTGEFIKLDKSGNVYVTGVSVGNGTLWDYATVKYNSNGTQLWASRYNSTINSYDDPAALTLDFFGNVFVTGFSRVTNSGITANDWATVKYDKNGNQLWIKYYNGVANSADTATAMAVDKIGNVYVTGAIKTTATYPDIGTIKYNQPDYCLGDWNNNCQIDFKDYALLSYYWMFGSDFNDLKILSENWLDGI